MTTYTHRQRVLTALDHRAPDRVPLDLGTVASGLTHEAYLALKAHLGIQSPTLVWQRRQLAQIDEAILRRFDIDTRQVVPEGPISETAGGTTSPTYVDAWGVTWHALPGRPYAPHHGPFGPGATLADLAAFAWPDPTDPKYVAGLGEKARAERAAGDYAIVMGLNGRVFTLGQFMCGFEEWCVALLQDKTFAGALMDRGLEIQLEIIGRQLDAVGDAVDIVCISEDLGMQSGPLLSPRLYRQMILPRHKRLFDFIHSRTRARLLLHCDGAIYDLLPDLVDAGVEVLNPVQVSAEGLEDTARLKREFGARLSFWGGIDTRWVLPRGAPADVREEVRRRIADLAGDGGFILTSVHNIQPEVPATNVCAMFEAAKELGIYA